ncbi:MAG: IS110 family transposase [Lachnospiraceae bacterium]|nr:IS110 family transposase [Lachnospiraceae bacterium]
MTKTVYIGMDVHSTNYTLSSYTCETDNCFSTVKLGPEVKNILKYINRIKEVHGDDVEIVTGYEAGCLGYTLYKDLKKEGIKCIIIAPTTLPKQKAGEIKTDKRDAQKIARALGTGTYKSVYVPDQEDDDVKQYIRMRDDHKLTLKKTKQQITAFCLRNGFTFTDGKSKWTQKHIKWLRSLEMTAMQREILDEYLITFDYYTLRIKQMDEKIEEISHQVRYAEKVSKLCCFAGMSTHKSLCHIVETGDFSRFAKAPSYSAYLGTVPGEDSSSTSVNRLPITKAGNSHLRMLDIEAAHAIGRTSKQKSRTLMERQKGCSSEIIAYADKANARMRKMYKDISQRKNKNVAAAAVARELACFIWGMMTDHIS